jgi:hypothetical protein
LIRYASLRKVTLLVGFLHIITCLAFFGPAITTEKFSLNVYTNGLILAISYLLAFPICFSVINKYPRQRITFTCFAVAAVLACLMSTSTETEGQGAFF